MPTDQHHLSGVGVPTAGHRLGGAARGHRGGVVRPHSVESELPGVNDRVNVLRSGLAIAALALLLGAGAAEAQVTLRVAASPGVPPIANAVTRGRASSISFDVTNTRAGTQLRQLELRLPAGYTIQGGLAPSGWAVTRISSGTYYSIRFAVAACAQGGIGSGATGTFRVDATPPNTTQSTDSVDALSRITASDPCGGATGWSVTGASSVTWPRKVLLVSGVVAPAHGAPPLSATATWTVTNLSSSTRSGLVLSPAAGPATGWSGGSCTPASLTLAAGASGTVSCAYAFTTPGSYALAATAAGTSVSAVGASAGTVLVGAATASFAFDSRKAGPGDTIHATLTVRNEGASPITATPPAYSALLLQNLARSSGTLDPTPASIPAGGSQAFVYSLDVSGPVGSQYLAQGTATTSAGRTNLAVTPAGTVSASLVDWSPAAVVKARTTAPYGFTVTVTNGSSSSISQVRVVNPQNATWTSMTSTGATGLGYSTRSITGGTTYLSYTGTLAPGATATLRFQFSAVPTVTQTTSYPFQVLVYPSNGGVLFTTYDVAAAVVIPIPDLTQLSILSDAGGQTLAWVNTSRADAPHDGVVVFRTPAPGVPTIPADGVDYTVAASPPADLLYADGDGAVTATLADPAPGAFNYRVCNHDAWMVYSNCNTGFWNGAGWLDSAVAPTGGWTHQLGGADLLQAGIIPGSRVGIATNAPAVAMLDIATGNRAFDPVALTALPASGTPAAQIADGRLLQFAADSGGVVSAFDLGAGAQVWRVTEAGESFVAGVSGIIRQYAPAAFQAAYPGDVLFMSSTSGRVLALNAATGATLWTVDTGVTAGVRANSWPDVLTNRLYVATNGGGVLAYDLGTSSPTTAPALLAGWVNPGGTYRLACGYAAAATDLACVDTAGTLRVLDKATGAVRASIATGASSPSALARVTGTAPGYVVGNASRVVRLLRAGTSPALSVAGQWIPAGLTLSPAQVFVGAGTIVVAASDKRLHKLALATASDTGQSVLVTSQRSTVLLGPPAFDVVNNLFVFGTDDGRVWAVPSF